MKMLSLFRPARAANQYEFIFSVEHKIRYFEECWQLLTLLTSKIWERNTMEVNGYHQLE